jgi:hypothetical protein
MLDWSPYIRVRNAALALYVDALAEEGPHAFEASRSGAAHPEAGH